MKTKSKPDKRLILFGGGPMPQEGIAQFLEWSEESEESDESKILLIAWASEEALITAEILAERFHGLASERINYSLQPPLTDYEKKYFLQQLENAGGVFFSGGNQNRILDVLHDAELSAALRNRYEAGVPFGGTSAGTAIMSPVCISGDLDNTILCGKKAITLREGLGLLPGTILDQHFLKRRRQNRLFGLALDYPHKLCIGVDEGVALAIVNDRYAEVIGDSQVMIVAEQGTGSLGVNLLKPGELFDLKLRKRGVTAKFGFDLAALPG